MGKPKPQFKSENFTEIHIEFPDDDTERNFINLLGASFWWEKRDVDPGFQTYVFYYSERKKVMKLLRKLGFAGR